MFYPCWDEESSEEKFPVVILCNLFISPTWVVHGRTGGSELRCFGEQGAVGFCTRCRKRGPSALVLSRCHGNKPFKIRQVASNSSLVQKAPLFLVWGVVLCLKQLAFSWQALEWCRDVWSWKTEAQTGAWVPVVQMDLVCHLCPWIDFCPSRHSSSFTCAWSECQGWHCWVPGCWHSAGTPGGGSTDKRGCKAGAACSAGEGILRTSGSTRGRERFISRVQALLVLFQLLKRVLFHRSTSYRFSSSLLDAHEVLLLRKRLWKILEVVVIVPLWFSSVAVHHSAHSRELTFYKWLFVTMHVLLVVCKCVHLGVYLNSTVNVLCPK